MSIYLTISSSPRIERSLPNAWNHGSVQSRMTPIQIPPMDVNVGRLAINLPREGQRSYAGRDASALGGAFSAHHLFLVLPGSPHDLYDPPLPRFLPSSRPRPSRCKSSCRNSRRTGKFFQASLSLVSASLRILGHLRRLARCQGLARFPLRLAASTFFRLYAVMRLSLTNLSALRLLFKDQMLSSRLGTNLHICCSSSTRFSLQSIQPKHSASSRASW